MRIAITGANGLLGRECAYVFAARHEVFCLGRNELDITSPTSVHTMLSALAPEWVVNCAAMTNVDACEDKTLEAFAINAFGPGLLARECRKLGAALMHVSTDYVFDGEHSKPYTEYERANPVNLYGHSKLAGEREIISATHDFVICRTQWLYGQGKARFLDTILSDPTNGGHKAIIDRFGCPTYARDLAAVMLTLVESDARGIFHTVNAGVASWFDFASEALRLTNRTSPLVQVRGWEIPQSARRPAYSALASVRLGMYKITPPRTWHAALKEFLCEREAMQK